MAVVLPTVSDSAVTAIILMSVLVGFLVAIYYAYQTSLISLKPSSEPLLPGHQQEASGDAQEQQITRVAEIVQAISDGANAFLYKEYVYLAVFIAGFSIIVLIAIGASTNNWIDGALAMTAFILGAGTSILAGFIGMRIAVYANGRVAKSAYGGIGPAFQVAFKAGTVMGFALVSLGLLLLFITIKMFILSYPAYLSDQVACERLYEAVSGFGLGGSSVALFARVGGGIFTKAADVGSDLVGKVEKNLPEDDARNPAVIADNVGDNVGDIAGMGADLFGSFAESTCAALVLTAQSADLFQSPAALGFPLVITAVGILASLITTFFATTCCLVEVKADVEKSLKLQLVVSTLIMSPVIFLLAFGFLPASFVISGKSNVLWWHIAFCILAGLWSGLIIGFITEYYTSHTYSPVRDVAESCKTGAATNIIFGLALGYKSVIVPVFCIAGTIFLSFSLAGMYGIAMAALGILSTLPVGLTIDAYGPISDNAGGIAEMAHMGDHIREHTDALDAAGNTTAAIGKGFAIGSAAFVSLALFGAFVNTIRDMTNQPLKHVDILHPFVFAGLLLGAMLPYWFSAMTMKSVGDAAYAMVQEVRRQFAENPAILAGTQQPDYAACVSISTEAALKEMIAPGCLVIFTPLISGFLFGHELTCGILVGALVSGVQIAISSSNTGGAWDNAKKYIESGGMMVDVYDADGNTTARRPSKKGDDVHKAAVVGDTVGDPLKDTSGPSLNILIKLMAIISLVFARAFPLVGYLPLLFGVPNIVV